MGGIGIVGTGISGLQLALFLQKAGVESVLYADKTPDEIRRSRLPNTVVRFGPTRRRERSAGVDFWDFLDEDWGANGVNFWIGAGPEPLTFTGSWSETTSMVDFRVYACELISAFADRGGKVVVGPLSIETVNKHSHDHDLMIVATGARELSSLFPRVPEHSPFESPQRAILAGYFHGIAQADPVAFSYNITPGIGEVFQGAFWTFGGKVSNLGFLAFPDGPMAVAAELDFTADPDGARRTVLDLLARYAPPVRERVTESEFALTGPLDILQGGITPTVRKGYAELESGRLAMAVGDSWVINDPIVGQGANMGSYCAKVMAERIAAAPAFDATFCAGCEAAMWEYGRAVTEWSNDWLAPLSPHAIGIMIAAAQNRALADSLVDGFADPVQQWARFATPAGARAFLAQYGMPLPQIPPM